MSDALERLKKRQRPSVPARDASLTSTPFQIPPISEASTSEYLAQESSIPPAASKIPGGKKTSQSVSSKSERADTSISNPQEAHDSTTLKTSTVSNPKPGGSLRTKQSTLRLEQGVSDRLQAVARREGLCREVLIEAMFEYCEAHPEAIQAVLEVSKTKNEHRQQIANLKRAKSMMERFGSV